MCLTCWQARHGKEARHEVTQIDNNHKIRGADSSPFFAFAKPEFLESYIPSPIGKRKARETSSEVFQCVFALVSAKQRNHGEKPEKPRQMFQL